jgi:hypothetical protein
LDKIPLYKVLGYYKLSGGAVVEKLCYIVKGNSLQIRREGNNANVMGDVEVCTDFKVKVPIIFFGTQGWTLLRGALQMLTAALLNETTCVLCEIE